MKIISVMQDAYRKMKTISVVQQAYRKIKMSTQRTQQF
jgi:predicted CopG family antitoxin